MKPMYKFSVFALVAALAACSTFETEKIDYKSASTGKSLDVPPDLTQLSANARYVAPGKAVSANALGQANSTQPVVSTVAVNALGDVRVEKQGNDRWLVVSRPADQLWGPVRDFWLENGFNLTTDQANIGILETDWAENRAKLPQDFIRKTLGKLLDTFYSTGERDRFRTRIERRADGGTDIYVSHRGMVEVYSDTLKENTIWKQRPSDPELENEFLRRLMQKLGAHADAQKLLTASTSATGATATPLKAQVVNGSDGAPVIQITDSFDRAWRRVGLSLDRAGFTVEDRDRSQATYFVRYVTPDTAKAEPGLFSRLFGSANPAIPPAKFRVVLHTQGETTNIHVQATPGSTELKTADVQRIVKVLAEDLQ